MQQNLLGYVFSLVEVLWILEANGGLPPDNLVEERDSILASTERIISSHHDGDMVNIVVLLVALFL